MKFVYYILFILLCCNNVLFSQQISVDDSIGLQALIQDNLVDGCVDISNISSSVNGSSSGFASYAYFEREGSNFPFEKGIMLSTGGAASGGNPLRTNTLSEGSTTWETDPDLEAALGTTNGYINATAIEFDFVSISNQFQFNYLLASEEYFDINPCQFSDGFVFLIKEAGSSDPYKNIALIPGTSIPVNTNTIHNEIFGICDAQNEQYFEAYGLGDTNYNGRTTVLTASGIILPNVTYHIKLIIADQTDGTFDSAVFIEGDSFRTLDLGQDISTCAGSVALNADIQNSLASYAWYRDNVLMAGETSSVLNIVQDGTYKVEVAVPVNGTTCVEDDEIVIVLNTEESMNSISDYELCEDSGGNTFDLSTKDAEIIPNIPLTFTNYDFSYHYSDAEARSNSNEITTPIIDPPSPQVIFVRVQDLDSNCFAFTSFNLIVNPIPDIISPTPLKTCDGDDNPNGFAVIDLTQKNDEIIAGNPNLFVTYHQNSLDVLTGENPLTTYINSSTPADLIYVRVVNTITGCVTTTTLDVEIEISPIVNRDTQFINACDSDLDGNANFDLTEVIDPILNGLSGVSITFHLSVAEAESNTNAIANETNYEYINTDLEPGSATLYLRIEDDVTGCASVIPFEVHTNLLLTATDTGDFALCDNNEDSTDSLDFNLFIIENTIANNLGVVNGLTEEISVTFYQSEEDRTNGNSLDKSILFSSLNPQVLYIRIDDGECIEETEITLIINPILSFKDTTILYCDDNDDGLASIDLESLDDTITGGDSNYEVTYFENEQDAEDNNTANQLPRFYANTNSTERLFARITTPGISGCSTVNPFQIEILTAPSVTPPSNIVECDNYDSVVDGFVIVNLNNKINEIVSNREGLDIDFFTSFDDADNKTNEIPESERDAYNTDTQTIYVRVEDIVSDTNCYTIVPFEASINTEPVISDDIFIQICKDDGTDVADFILSEIDDEVLNGQLGKEVFYFEDSTFTTPIDKNNVYQNTSREQTIYLRVENVTDATCFETGLISLRVSPAPIYNPLIDYLICDDSSNDGRHTFNLDEKAAELRQGLVGDNLNISFHRTFDEADSNANPLPSNYTNTINPQTIFIRIENDNSLCHVVERLGINIVAAPNVTQVASPLISCATGFNGIATFNLELSDFEILDRVQSNLTINYFNDLSDINQADGLDNSNEIVLPSSFNSVSKTVYIKIANTLTSCFTVIPLELITNTPPVFNTIETIPICDNETNTFALSIVDNMVVDNTSLVNISYHSSFDDAEDNLLPLNNIYAYINPNQTIYIRLSDINTNCHITTSFVLQINPNPIAIIPPNLISCDDDFDGVFTFNLGANSNTILGTQPQSTFSVSYYESLTDAEVKSNPLSMNHSAQNGDTIYARLENNNTGCFDTTQFYVTIHPLPVIPIKDMVSLCLDDSPLIIDVYTGDPDDIYLWSTNVNMSVNNSTSRSIEIGPTEIGEYSVTVTTINNCSFTKIFSVIESEQAEISFTSSVDFKDPNSITVDLDLSRKGNYVYILDGGNPQTSNVFENVSFGMHTVTVSDLNGCRDISKDVFVFDIPKFVTPNGDGFYDTWHVIGANQLTGTIVYIYNRYGKLLKTLSHDSMGWDGTYNGQNMPSDDYWFLASIVQDGNTFDIKGHFTLKR